MKLKEKKAKTISEAFRFARDGLIEIEGGLDALIQSIEQSEANEGKPDPRRKILDEYIGNTEMGVKTATDPVWNPGSLHGEKTVDSMVSKNIRKLGAVGKPDGSFEIDKRYGKDNFDYRIIGKTGSNKDSMCDIIRDKIIAGKFVDVLLLIDIMYESIGEFYGELVHHPKRGYRGNHFSVNNIKGTDGLMAEIQIGTEMQEVLNAITHAFSYSTSRDTAIDRRDSEKVLEAAEKVKVLDRASKSIYELIFQYDSAFQSVDQMTRAKIIDLLRTESARSNDRKKIADALDPDDKMLRDMVKRPFKKVGSVYVVDKEIITTQAEQVQEFAQPRQEALNAWCKDIFEKYVARLKRDGSYSPDLTERQEYISRLFDSAIKKRIDAIHLDIHSGKIVAEDAEEHFRVNYGEEIDTIQNGLVLPMMNQGAFEKSKTGNARKDLDSYIKGK